MAGRYVKFDQNQAKRIANTVRDYERSFEQGVFAENSLGFASRVPNPNFAVLVTIDGGSAGSISTTCTFTYTVKTLNGETLATAKTPKKRRFPNMIYTSTPANTVGVAYFDETYTLQLLDANELPDLESCSSSFLFDPYGLPIFDDPYAGGE